MRNMQRGAIGMNILLFMFISGVFLFLVGFSPITQAIMSFVGVSPTTGNINNGDLALAFVGLFAVVAVIVGTLTFPNPYVIFAPVAAAILAITVSSWGSFISSAGFPTTPVLGQNIPVAALLIGGTLGFLSLLSVIAFLKGGEW